MKEHLKAVAESYDRAIDLGRKGIDLYKNLPPEITNIPNYPLYVKMQSDDDLSDSGRREIFDYLSPGTGMKFIDFGCCLNLMFRGYRQWQSVYYGVDISCKTIELLLEYTARNRIPVGGLYCGSMHETPFDSDFFDIGACIGSLEYFESGFVEQVIRELHRILKPKARAVIDIPDVGSPEFEITGRIEAYLGRADRFDLSVEGFEALLEPCFEVAAKEKVGPMIQYFISPRPAAV